ncbi:hypothetical protein CAL7716_106950 (plasmid) [Calothrix sp. PCC 7716]|nr:hypothetical protein CAL7716_106950 [Calothrix sp. PCC 7716]
MIVQISNTTKLSPGNCEIFDFTLEHNHLYRIYAMSDCVENSMKIRQQCYMEIYNEHSKKVAESKENSGLECFISLFGNNEPIKLKIFVFREKTSFNSYEPALEVKVLAFEMKS